MNPQNNFIFTNLGTRLNYNNTLKHLIHVTTFIDRLEKKKHLADLVTDLINNNQLTKEQILPIVSVVLQEKLNASFSCYNLLSDLNNSERFNTIAQTIKKWNAVELTCVYHHPHIGICIINPSNIEHWESLQGLKQNELLVVYARSWEANKTKEARAIEAFLQLLKGETPNDRDLITVDNVINNQIKEKPVLNKVDNVTAQKPPVNVANAVSRPPATSVPKPTPAPAATPSQPVKSDNAVGGKPQLTPKYSIQVSNELFHNGNVEAWKNIIESYVFKHPGSKVIVYHEGELIQDLNSLFKWGKVKHGGLIFFQVSGVNIKNVSRLQKYLFEGASKRYESFMKHDVNKVLQLF